MPDQLIVLFMRPDPEPEDSIGDVDTECPMMKSDSNGVIAADALQAKRRVRWVFLQKSDCTVGEITDVARKRIVRAPEAR